jgi:F-type H+-transporting ATPase subunit epsilon
MALHLQVVTPKGVAVEKEVDELAVPGVLGEFGILEGHIPVLSALRPGVMWYRVGSEKVLLALGGRGYVELGAKERVMVLTDLTAKKDEVDIDQAKSELSDAEQEIAAWEGAPDATELKLLYQKAAWARACIELAGA